jgi:hypothetical protein
MSYIALGIVGGALISYAGTQSTNSANAANARNSGHVNLTTTRAPTDNSAPYRDAGTLADYQALTGQQNGIAGNPAAGGGTLPTTGGYGYGRPAGGGGASRGPATWTNAHGQAMTLDAHGRAVSASGGGAAATAPSGPDPNNTSAPGGGKFTGISQNTQDAENALRALPAQEAGMYNTAQQYATDTLQGKDTNAIRGQADMAAQDIKNDPQLAAYEASLRGLLGVPGGAGGGGGAGGSSGPIWTGNPSGGSGGWGGTGQAQLQSPYASTTGADAAIRELIAGKAAPGEQAAEDAITQQVAQGRASNIRDLRARAVGSGFYGGDVYQQLEEGAIAQGDQQTANQIAASRFGAYQNALGLGTQYDLGMANVAAQEHATSAGAGSAAAATAAQLKLGELGMWGNAIQTGQQGRAGTASALGNLSGQYSADQQASLSGVNALGASRRSDLTAAGDLSLGSDQARTSYGVGMAGANASRAVGLANVNLGQNQLNFAQNQFYDPLTRLGAYGNVLNGLTGAYGTETTQGQDQRSMAPPAYANPYGAALSGAAAGGAIASAYG